MAEMKKDQFRVLVKAMKAVYTQPGFLPDDDSAQVWYSLLKDLDYRTLSAAIQKVMMSSPYPPTIADIRAAASAFTHGHIDTGMSELAAWEMVRRAISNSNYNADEEFEKLPALVQKAVGNPANLREWASMDIETVNSVEQSHFIRAFRAAVTREGELQKLSPTLRQLIERATARIGATEPQSIEMEEKE